MSGMAETDDFDPEVVLRRHMEADAAVLGRAAARLRWLGWFWFFTFGVIFIFSLAVAGVGKIAALFAGLIVGVILIGISMFYFALATYVGRGHRWAISIALFLASTIVAILLWNIFTPKKIHPLLAVMEAMYLLGTLSLFKVLIQSLGAARRLDRLARREVVEEYAMIEDRA
jgi:hypothetical protein